MEDNSEKWALITGACGGIGSALVDVFSTGGYKVIATDKHESWTGNVDCAVYMPLDLKELVSSEIYTKAVFENIIQLTNGRGISALINNAAVQNLDSIDHLSRKAWMETFSVNLHAPFFLIQALSGSLEKNDGCIVNISSIHANQTKSSFVAYATSKAALSSLTRNLAVEFGDRIRVNAIEPAAVGTKMLIDGFKDNEEKMARLEALHPLGRIALPKEIAELALYLCSEKSSFVHGECISASGGIDRRLSDPEE